MQRNPTPVILFNAGDFRTAETTRATNLDPISAEILCSLQNFLHGAAEGDAASGTIYVLRSKSDHPLVAENRSLVHKIGVTNASVEQRIAGARLQPTFLMADVEVVATYDLYNINRAKLEHLIHRVFAPARLDIEIKDRFGKPMIPREWFLVPLYAIDDAVEKIRNGSISGYRYDPRAAKLEESS